MRTIVLMEVNVGSVARMVPKMAIKTKPRLIVMDQDCDFILDRIRSRMRSVYVRSAIKHYYRWQEQGQQKFDDPRLDRYGTADVNLRMREYEDQIKAILDQRDQQIMKVKQLEIDIQALSDQRKKRWWQFW